MFHAQDPTVWISAARRKLQLAASPDRPRDQDKLLRKVLLRNSISRVDLALAEIQPSSSSQVSPTSPLPPTQEPVPIQPVPEATAQPPRADEDEFVFPDATSLATSRVFTNAETNVEEKWLDSLLEDLSDDEYDDDDEATARGASSPFDEEEEDHDEDYYLDAESLAWLLSTTAEEPQPIISVPSPTSVSVRALSPPRALPHEPLTIDDLPFYSPLPDDDDDDLSTVPGMEEDEGESEADSVEWPLTPGQRSITSILGRSTSNSNSSLNQLVASAERDDDNTVAIGGLPSITEDAAYDHPTRLDIHVDEPPLYRYSPNPGEMPLPLNDATPALGGSC